LLRWVRVLLNEIQVVSTSIVIGEPDQFLLRLIKVELSRAS